MKLNTFNIKLKEKKKRRVNKQSYSHDIHSAEQLENEKYWETQVKIWEIQRKRDLINSVTIKR